MPLVEFTAGTARDLWRDVIGWILGKIVYRVDDSLPEPITGLVRRLD